MVALPPTLTDAEREMACSTFADILASHIGTIVTRRLMVRAVVAPLPAPQLGQESTSA